MYRLVQYALVALLGLSLVSATSAPPRPLKRVAHPTTLALEILPRRPSTSPSYDKRASYPPTPRTALRHDDAFRLTLRAFGDTFHLHLRPNEHLLHPAARVHHFALDARGQSVLRYTEALRRESVRAYWGEVVRGERTEERMREDAAGVWPRPSGGAEELGWARVVVLDQGDGEGGVSPVWEGAFEVRGVVYHVMTRERYLATRLAEDPHVRVEEVGGGEEDGGDAGLVVFRDSDVMTPEEVALLAGVRAGAAEGGDGRGRTCGHDRLDFNTNPLVNPTLRRPAPPPVTPWYDPFHLLHPANASLARRDDVAGGAYTTNFASNIGQTAGCPSTQKVIYMGVAADCVYTSTYGSTQKASAQIISTFNTASALYKSTFNVSLGIVELQVHDAACPTTTDPSTPWNIPCQDDVTLNDRLSLFSQWRGDKGNDGAGLWHLMSGCPTGTEVGIAWLGTLCQQTAQGDPGNVVSGTAVSTSGRVEWQVVAHEIGHNFGAIHDCADGCDASGGTTQCCPFSTSSCDANAQFIMSPVAESNEMKFSPCSLGNICSLMQTGATHGTNTTCLVDPSSATQTISLQMCGNGIVEDGEDCDPGQGSTSSCCDVATCKFRSGAVCDPANSACCTAQCGFAAQGTVCRPAKDATCDVAEVCSGTGADCPADVTEPNGKKCGSGGLACASGTCTSLDKQCQTVGASLGLQKACPSRDDKSCQVSCQDPSSSNQCIVLQSPLIDGSPCGYGGKCFQGSCKPGSVWDTIKAWYVQNLQISIPITVVAGLVILLLLWFITRAIIRCCRRRKQASGAGSIAALKGQRAQRLASWDSPPMGQVPAAYGYYGSSYSQNQYAHARGRSDGWQGQGQGQGYGYGQEQWQGQVSPSHRATRSTGSTRYGPS